MLNEDYAAEIEQLLSEVENSIYDAVAMAEELESMVVAAGNPENMAGRIRLYLRNNLKTWIEDRGQIGSIPSLREELHEMVTYDPEDGLVVRATGEER